MFAGSHPGTRRVGIGVRVRSVVGSGWVGSAAGDLEGEGRGEDGTEGEVKYYRQLLYASFFSIFLLYMYVAICLFVCGIEKKIYYYGKIIILYLSVPKYLMLLTF